MKTHLGERVYVTEVTGDYITISKKRDGNGIKTHKDNLCSAETEIEVGTRATLHGYSDSKPYEVVGFTPSKKTIFVRELDAELDEEFKKNMDWKAGGFAGHLANQDEQKWHLSSNKENTVLKARLTSKGWKFGNSYLSVGVGKKFYDYNF